LFWELNSTPNIQANEEKCFLVKLVLHSPLAKRLGLILILIFFLRKIGLEHY